MSCGVDVGFPSEIVISLVVFIRFLFLNVYFHLFRVFLHSFFEILRIIALLTLDFSFCTKIFTRSCDCDITFKMEVNRELSEE